MRLRTISRTRRRSYFVVDASSITRNGKIVAEVRILLTSSPTIHTHSHLIYSLKVHAPRLARNYSLPPTHALPPVLVLAHKADLVKAPLSSTLASGGASSQQERTSLATSRVRTILERELEARRAAQASGVAVEGLGEEGEGTEMGGVGHARAEGRSSSRTGRGADVTFVGTWVASGRKLVGVNSEKDEKRDAEAEDGLDGLRDWLDTLS